MPADRQLEPAEVDGTTLREALDTIESAIALFDRDLRLTYANRKFCEMHLAEQESQLLGKSFDAVVDSIAHILVASSRQSILQLLRRLARRPDGTQREIRTGEGRSFRFRVDRQSSGDVMFTLRNVTAQRVNQELAQEKTRQLEAAVDALRTSEARFRAVVEDQTEMICRFDRDFRLTFVNPAYCAAFGRSAEALIGSSFLDLLVDEAARRSVSAALAKLTPERPILRGEYAEHVRGGQVRWQSWVNRALFAEDGRLVEYQAVGRDVTREREVKDALERSEQHFKSIAEAHPVPVLIFDRESQALLHASPATVPLLGRSVEQVHAIELDGLFAGEGDRARFEAAFWPAGRIDQFEAQVAAADGRALPAELTARAVEYEGRAAIALGVVDITERKAAEAEIARQQEALVQGEKLSALGSLLASVSHELNNPLSIVVAQSQLLEELAEDAKSKRRATRIREAAERCGRIVKTFLAMARQKPPSRVPVEVNRLAADAASLVAYAFKTGSIELALEQAPDLPQVSGDPDQLVQVVVNLLINAQQALVGQDPPRRVGLRTGCADGRLTLCVEDNGPGVPEALQARIFEPFFTTKPEGLGTGIGLAVSRNIARGHGGELSLDTGPTGGARFVLALPVIAAAEQDAPAAGLDGAAWRALPPLEVLVVDDEPDLAVAIGEILAVEGHRVLTAETGRAALELLRHGRVDLVLSDLRMPDLDGPGLYAAIRAERLHPTGRVGFITGDTLGAEVRRFLDRVPAPVIEKPFQAEELKAFILRILEAG